MKTLTGMDIGRLRDNTYVRDGNAFSTPGDGVLRPLEEDTDRIVDGEAGGEDEGDGLIHDAIPPVELAVVDEHDGRDEENG